MLKFDLQKCLNTAGKGLVEEYPHEPYSFLGRNSTDLGKTIRLQLGLLIRNAIKLLMDLITKGMIAIAFIILIILTDPKLIISVGILVVEVYGVIFYFANNHLNLIKKNI